MKQQKVFIAVAITTVLFCLAVGFDVTPYLRGPSYYPPEWRWEYFFVNTIHVIYLPILVSMLLIGLYIREETKNTFKKKRILLFILLVMFLCFSFQLSVLFFSRSGVAVLIHRIINPELNGYFTASLTIHNVADFLRNYNETMLHYVYHAKSHPPGAILFFYVLKQMIAPFTLLVEFANNLTPSHSDVNQVWNALMPIDKATALFSAFFIPLLSTVSLIPLYFSAKILYGTRVALRSIFLLFFIPTIVFFIPINDSFLHIFSITSFYFLVYGLSEKNLLSIFISGALLFLGVFFNLSLLPVVVLFFVFAAMYLLQNKAVLSEYLKGATSFASGFLLPGMLLNFFFQFNFIQIFHTITTYAPGNMARSYLLWVYFNLQDFLIFCGIPVALIFLLMIKDSCIKITKKQFTKIDPLFIAFFIMIMVLNFSGFVLGEVGRLWASYIPFIVLITVSFMTTQLKFSRKLFAGILTLQVLLILVMQEFWVMLW